VKARLRILLPYKISVGDGPQVLAPHERNEGDYRVQVHPPYRSCADRTLLEPDSPGAVANLVPQLEPADPQPATKLILLDGVATVQADALRIDFWKDEFDRSHGTDDPPTELCFEIANQLLARLRTLSRAPVIRPVAPNATVWHLRYLTDADAELAEGPEQIRGRGSAGWTWSAVGLNRSTWEQAGRLRRDWHPPTSDNLLLDAVGLLPEVGPALVLAATAVETRLESASHVLAKETAVNSELWNWINDRGDYRKEPSVSERADKILHALVGESLKGDRRLWEAFKNLRDARNSFVHGGRAYIGKEAVSRERASQLIALAGDIIEWLEDRLPEEERRPKLEATPQMQLTKLLIPPAEPTTSEEGLD